ncbi:hypothetical protein [Bernardetia sp. MNP-M8]|uniref:hypothetical protein n=1 Tax=Bernardetia sp. MNP-M8 TaxID=3127470 RepID=UPI0030D00F65
MMTIKTLTLTLAINLLIGFTNFVFCQDVKVTASYGSKNQEIQDIIDFQNIFIEKFNFASDSLIGKWFEVNIQEYKDGNLVNTTLIFDGSESDYFKIDSSEMSIKIFTDINDSNLITSIFGKRFRSKKMDFELTEDSKRYVLKDFFGSNDEIQVSLKQEFPILAIITPTLRKDGSSSYCEVVQSNIKPEELGKHFDIPHYFLITMKFK